MRLEDNIDQLNPGLVAMLPGVNVPTMMEIIERVSKLKIFEEMTCLVFSKITMFDTFLKL